MKRPAFQFYPGDWLRSTDLRSCSVGARGLWIDMICLMHEGTPYGYLKVGSKDIDKDTLARITGCLPTECEIWLNELIESGVCGKEDGTILCRRMIRDERTRNAREKGGALSVNNPNVPKQRIPSDPSLGVSPASASASAIALKPSRTRTKRAPVVKANGESKSATVWNAYSTSFFNRYGVEPVRNASVNSQLAKLVDRLGAIEAPSVAAFYVTHNKAFYVGANHSTSILLRDAEGLRKEWATGNQTTETAARKLDQGQAQCSVWAKLQAEGKP